MAADPEQQQPNEARRRAHDVIVFGASGSVGRFIVEEMALVTSKEARHHQPDSAIRWAIAGRSRLRLQEALSRAELSTGIEDLGDRVACLQADLEAEESLLEICSRTSLMLNCTGPSWELAEALVRACIKTQTNYVDISNEASFIEHIRRRYHEEAQMAGVYIVNGCGFQAMSAELGLNYLKQAAGCHIAEVKIRLGVSAWRVPLSGKASTRFGRAHTGGTFSAGQWRSLLIERGQQLQLSAAEGAARGGRPPQGRRPSPAPATTRPAKLRRRDTLELVLKSSMLQRRHSLDWYSILRGLQGFGRQSYSLAIGALTSEESQLIKSEMSNYETNSADSSLENWRPIRCSSFLAFDRLWDAVRCVVWLLAFSALSRWRTVRSLAMSHPRWATMGLVSCGGDERRLDRRLLSQVSYYQYFFAYGSAESPASSPAGAAHGLGRAPPGQLAASAGAGAGGRAKQEQILVSRVTGPEPNHVATASLAVQAAIVLLREQAHLPPGRGVLTPGAAFAETNIIHQLRQRNFKFEVVKTA